MTIDSIVANSSSLTTVLHGASIRADPWRWQLAHKQPHDLDVPVLCGPVKRRPSEPVLGVRIRPELTHKQPHGLDMPVLRGHVKRRMSEPLLGVGIRPELAHKQP